MADDFENHCWKDTVPPDVLDIYKHYSRKTFVGPSPALLAIDLYELAYQGGAKPVAQLHNTYPSTCGENAHAAIEPTKRLFAAARAAGIPVIYTTRKPDTRGVNSTHRDHGGNALPEDIYDIYEAFPPQPGELIIHKERASGFFGTPLVAHLRLMGVDSLIVCGESTSGCVRASVVEGYSYGYHITVVEECTYDRSMLSHKVNLFDLHHKYADVMKVDEVIAHLTKMARKVA
jgi:nicotinamidase-related amidase